MGKWIAFSLVSPLNPNISGWEAVLQETAAHDLVDLRDRIEAWLRANRTHSTKCWLVYGEREPRRGKLPDQHFPFFNHTSSYIRVKFRSARDATIFKLYFSEYMFAPDHTRIRGVMAVLLSNTMAATQKGLLAHKTVMDQVAQAFMIPAELFDPVKIATVRRV